MGGDVTERSAKGDNGPSIEHGEQDADCHPRGVAWDQSGFGYGGHGGNRQRFGNSDPFRRDLPSMGGIICGWASGNQGGMNRRLGCDYGPVSDGFRCSSDAAFSVAEKKEGILVIDLLRCTLVDLLHLSSNNSFQPPSKTTNTRG